MNRQYSLIAALLFAVIPALRAQIRPVRPVLTGREQAISDKLGKLRSLPDDEWTKAVGALARDIQNLPASPAKGRLISSLSNLVTEGDAGHDTLQVVASTMAQVLRDLENPRDDGWGWRDIPALNAPNLAGTLARLVRYEHVEVSVDSLSYYAAMKKLEAEDRQRMSPDFTLSDLNGAKWSLKDLRGKVVMVNFWATWCPPCRKEMPDMEALYQRFGPRGLVVLAISDEEAGKVTPFIGDRKYTYPILLDPGRKVNQLFAVEGIPKTFLYGRDGKLVTQAIDRRTERQFLEMLKLAGLE